MLTSQMGNVAPNGGVHMETALLRPKIVVTTTVWTRLNICSLFVTVLTCSFQGHLSTDERPQLCRRHALVDPSVRRFLRFVLEWHDVQISVLSYLDAAFRTRFQIVPVQLPPGPGGGGARAAV